VDLSVDDQHGELLPCASGETWTASNACLAEILAVFKRRQTSPGRASRRRPRRAERSLRAAGAVLRWRAPERSQDGIFLAPPDAPGLGLELDDAVAAASLVPE